MLFSKKAMTIWKKKVSKARKCFKQSRIKTLGDVHMEVLLKYLTYWNVIYIYKFNNLLEKNKL